VRERWRTDVLPGARHAVVASRDGINESDWNIFLGHATTTFAKFKLPEADQHDVVAFVQSLKKDIVE